MSIHLRFSYYHRHIPMQIFFHRHRFLNIFKFLDWNLLDIDYILQNFNIDYNTDYIFSSYYLICR